MITLTNMLEWMMRLHGKRNVDLSPLKKCLIKGAQELCYTYNNVLLSYANSNKPYLRHSHVYSILRPVLISITDPETLKTINENSAL